MNEIEVIRATDTERKKALAIAETLTDWFNETGLKNMKTDFEHNNVVVAKVQKRVVGFVCYTSHSGKWLLLWMGVEKDSQGEGVGSALLDWLVHEGKKQGLHAIEVETLPNEDEYEPYKQTRDFYYKNGFKKILYKKASIEGWDDQILLEKKL